MNLCLKYKHLIHDKLVKVIMIKILLIEHLFFIILIVFCCYDKLELFYLVQACVTIKSHTIQQTLYKSEFSNFTPLEISHVSIPQNFHFYLHFEALRVLIIHPFPLKNTDPGLLFPYSI